MAHDIVSTRWILLLVLSSTAITATVETVNNETEFVKVYIERSNEKLKSVTVDARKMSELLNPTTEKPLSLREAETIINETLRELYSNMSR